MGEIFHNIGIWAAICAACALLAIVQSLLLVAICFLGKRIWQRVTRTYALHVVSYWLRRLEAEGTHCFEKASSLPPGK
jgi:uncharacterized membrane protein YhiD involved in acid resistance